MIDEKVLIERVEEYQGKIKLNFGNRGNFDFMEIEAVKDIANQLAKKHNNGWIPCSERLPEDESEMLFTSNCGITVFGYYSKYLNKCVAEGYAVPIDFIAWMPLPAPYKEKEGKNEP